MVHRKAKCQIEVAIIKSAIPAHAELMAAHQSCYGLGVKGFSEKCHIVSFLVLLVQFLSKSAQGHVGDGEEAGERDAELISQLPPIVFFKG